MSAKNLIVRLWKEEEGASLLEYGLLIGFIAVLAIGALTIFGQSLIDLFTDTEGRIAPIPEGDIPGSGD